MRSLETKVPPLRSSQRQKAEWWAPGAGEGVMGVSVFTKYGVSVWGRWKSSRDGWKVALQCECI